MIAHLRGRVAHRDAGSVVIDVNGVGYLVHVTPGERIPARGEPVELHTSLQVREESMTVYGFAERTSLRLFELLLSSSGVGPKLALAALGTHRPDVLRTAIAGADVATLTQVPGIGKKVAERLVLELKDKVGGPLDGDLVIAAADVGRGDPGVLAEVRDALLALGYTSAEVQASMRVLDTSEAASTPDLLRQALRVLGGGARDGARS